MAAGAQPCSAVRVEHSRFVSSVKERWDLRPKGIILGLDLLRPHCTKTAETPAAAPGTEAGIKPTVPLQPKGQDMPAFLWGA